MFAKNYFFFLLQQSIMSLLSTWSGLSRSMLGRRLFSATCINNNKVDCYISNINDAYTNLALEEYLLRETKPERHILYLWRNKPCVVVGRNQNPFQECNLRFMSENDIPLVRRRSGGGAVYHVR